LLALDDPQAVVNAFEEGQALMKKFHDIAVHFANSQKRRDKLNDIAGRNDWPAIKFSLARDDGTRVSMQCRFLLSMLRMNKSVKTYLSTIQTGLPHVTPEEWLAISEFQGVFDVSALVATLQQTEQAFTCALGLVLKRVMMEEFRSIRIVVIDQDNVTKDPKVPKVKKSVSDFTDVGRTCLFRATLEAERRYCGNKGDELTNADVVPTDRELVSVLLDPRTVNSLSTLGLKSVKEMGLPKLRAIYVAYGQIALKYDQDEHDKEHDGIIAEPEPEDNGTDDSDNNCWDSEDEADGNGTTVPPKATPSRPPDKSAADFKTEFSKCFNMYRKRCAEIAWKDEAPNLGIVATKKGALSQDDVVDLWYLPMGHILKQFITEDPDRKKYGHLPYMATGSKASIGALLASSFCERINSAANIVLHDGNLKLGEEEINKMTVLRMNRTFMQHMRSTYPNVTLEELKRHYNSNN
jgi:hypothetical protein